MRLFLLLVLLTMNSVALHAATELPAEDNPASGFGSTSTMEFDINTDIEAEPEPVKNNLAYNFGVDGDKHTTVNRLEWRLQWEKLLDNNFWVIDGKLRAFADNDQQYDSNDSVAGDIKLYALYLQRSFDKQSIKIGYQTVVFGYMDLVNVSNTFTPQDFSEAVYTAPEDSRIGQPVFSWSYYLTTSQLDLFINLAPTKNEYPLAGFRDIVGGYVGSSDFTLHDQLPDVFDEPELAIKWQQQAGKHEYQLILASLIQNDPEIKITSLLPTVNIDLQYPRYEFASAAYSFTEGNYQLKLETAFNNDIRPVDTLGHTVDETSLALGWEYNANGAYNLLFETMHLSRSIVTPYSSMAPASLIEKSLDQTAISWRKNFLNETLNVVLYLGYSHPGNIRISSLSLRYSPVDDWLIELITTQVDSDQNTGDLLSDQTALRLGYYW